MNEGYGRLVITVRPGDVVTIGDDIAIAYEKYSGGQMKMLINAPKSMRVLRHEEERNSVSGNGPQTVKRNPRPVGR
jgi:sRNA-binding carbon storage regulator CsrA